jgi:nucleotide-binding universal stress UspA family protein
VLKLVERWPAVVYLGAGVLVWTGVVMLRGEPFVKAWLADHPAATALGYVLVPAVLLAAFVRNHRRLDSRIRARLSELAGQRPRVPQASHEGEPQMLNVLVPIDGSENGLNALRHAIDEYRRDHDLRLHLLHVQPRLSRHVARFVSRGDRAAWHAERADAALAAAREVLERARVPYVAQWRVGERAHEICRTAEQLGCHHIVMGTARRNTLTRMLQDSVTHRVLENASVPVEVVVGPAVSRLERWGLPAGVGLGLGGVLWIALAD